MITETPPHTGSTDSDQLVSSAMLLERLFPDGARPTVRWLEMQRKRRLIPFYKCGHLVRFDVGDVRQAMRDRLRVNAA
jgi:hypothetical protein